MVCIGVSISISMTVLMVTMIISIAIIIIIIVCLANERHMALQGDLESPWGLISAFAESGGLQLRRLLARSLVASIGHDD